MNEQLFINGDFGKKVDYESLSKLVTQEFSDFVKDNIFSDIVNEIKLEDRLVGVYLYCYCDDFVNTFIWYKDSERFKHNYISTNTLIKLDFKRIEGAQNE